MEAMIKTREIGPIGTAARVGVGGALVVLAALIGLDAAAILVGAVAVPFVVTGVIVLRGRRAEPLRAHEPYWHCVNIGIGVAFAAIYPAAAALFYGGSMLLAAWRGFGACELLAAPNALLGRNDQLACPLFLPIDATEARATGRRSYCS